ncbi:MAG: hypothetical protein Q8M76_12290, partial [Spirochaetaceae bacterium]|nr:hypothetical protein [Spirochaetaceae bacterium]
MGLRAKTTLILAATICLAAFALVGTSQLFSNKYIEVIEIREAEEALRRAMALVYDDVAQLDVIVR